MLVQLAMDTLGMTSISDPVEMPQHIKTWTSQKKLEWLVQFVQPFVNKLYQVVSMPSFENIEFDVICGHETTRISVPPHLQGQQVDVLLNSNFKRTTITVPKPSQKRDSADDMVCYNLCFLRSMMDFLVLQDVIYAADINRLTVVLKRLIPKFVELSSFRSKYAIECINYITKTEWVLSPREATKAKLRSFVNTRGLPGHNKPADMQQENNIKMVKGVLRALGASRTPSAVVRSSKAAPAVTEMASNFQQGMQVKQGAASFSHYKKDSADDCELIRDIFSVSKPFVDSQRNIPGLPRTTGVDLYKLCDFIKRNSKRAVHHIIDFCDE